MSGPKHDTEAPSPKKASIAVDNWKLPTFRKQLAKAGYEIVSEHDFSKDVTLLGAPYTDMLALKRVVEKCTRICERKRPK